MTSEKNNPTAPENNSQKLQELQFLEQAHQNLLMQKQAFQMELSESESALEQISESGSEVFKIIGQIMVKSKPETMKKELQEKKKIIDLRIQNIEKQESSINQKIQDIQEELTEKKK
ncbi:prefoldin subunit [Candidatus Pacearchaeota archaeon]|nr:prefoldin subunit [Candidatus Pacearchaeota archaeon]